MVVCVALGVGPWFVWYRLPERRLPLLLLRLCPRAFRAGVRLLPRLQQCLWVVLLSKCRNLSATSRPHELRLRSQIRRLLGKSRSSCPLLVRMWMDRRLVRVGVSVCVALCVCVCVCVCVGVQMYVRSDCRVRTLLPLLAKFFEWVLLTLRRGTIDCSGTLCHRRAIYFSWIGRRRL